MSGLVSSHGSAIVHPVGGLLPDLDLRLCTLYGVWWPIWIFDCALCTGSAARSGSAIGSRLMGLVADLDQRLEALWALWWPICESWWALWWPNHETRSIAA